MRRLKFLKYTFLNWTSPSQGCSLWKKRSNSCCLGSLLLTGGDGEDGGGVCGI